MPSTHDNETTYPLRAAARMTGLSPDLLRAWETRYGVVRPLRTAGGTRRYRAADLEGLRLVKAAVDAGDRIGVVAKLDPAELARRAGVAEKDAPAGLGPILTALERLDAEEARRLLALQLTAMGPTRFARDLAIPLAAEIGLRWASDRMDIASEHLATGVLRSMLGSALTPDAASRLGPKIVFATPIGERHELGLQSAALTAMGAGANPIYLGAELPAESLVRAVANTRSVALAMSLVTIASPQARHEIAAIRDALDDDVKLWLGGRGAADFSASSGIDVINGIDDFETKVSLLVFT